MPASMASVATLVSAAPSVGSSTMASTLSLMNVSTWLICMLGSVVPSATRSVTSEYFLASFSAVELIAPSQPWSASGPENPITTFLPGSSFGLAALTGPPPPLSSGVLLVHEAMIRPIAASNPAERSRAELLAMVPPEWDRTNAWQKRAGLSAARAGGTPSSAGSGGVRRTVRAAGEPLLQQHGDHDDHALGHGLGRRVEVVEGEHVGQRGEDQHAEHGADDGAAAAGEQRPADHHGGDRVEFVELTVRRGARGGAGQQHDRGETARQAEQDVQHRGVPLHLDARQPGGLDVAADGQRAAAERGAVEQDPAADGDRSEDDHQHRDAQYPAGEEIDEPGHGDDLRLLSRDHLGEAAGACQHRQRDDERCYSSVGDEQTVDQPTCGADRQRRGHDDDPAVVG